MIPLIITMDLEVARDYDLGGQRNALLRINSDFKKNNIPLTIFVNADAVDCFRNEIKSFDSSFTEFGTHGNNHQYTENYKKLSKEEIRKNISLSVESIAEHLNDDVECFRGPFMSTSATTQEVLEEKNFRADYSVCPQRLDFMNSNGGDIRWMTAPRQPYHPSHDSPYSEGSRKIWVIPLSCVGLPFISSALYIMGLSFMKVFFKMLLKEAELHNKPIVYLFHSYEFAGKHKNMKDVQTPKSRLHSLYPKDHNRRYDLNLGLISYMLSFDLIEPSMSKVFLNQLETRA